MIVIGITGTLGAGKGTVVEHLVSRGFGHFSARDLLTEEVKKRGLPIVRDSMKMVGDELRRAHGPAYVAEALFDTAAQSGANAVIESLRVIGEIEYLKEKNNNFVLFAVDAPSEIRYERAVLRKSETDAVSYEKFLIDEKNESKDGEKWEMNLPGCQALADYRFMNGGTKEELFKEVDAALTKIGII